MCATALLFALATSLQDAQAAAPPVPPPGFVALFDGRSLDGWRGRPQMDPRAARALPAAQRAERQRAWDADLAAHWRVEDGAIVNDGAGVFLTTARDYGDFDLRLQYRTVAGADSGIYLRGCPQVQIWDTTEAGGKWEAGADRGSGGLWNNREHARFPLAHADRPFGEWNDLRIRMIGERVSAWLNGVHVVDHVPLENYFDRARPVPPRGPIQFQTHGGEIRFRAVHLREIGPHAADALLSARDAGGFRPVFDGESLDGWAGATDAYQAVDGTLRCRPGAGGTLHTESEYGDFVARLEFRLPPGGNNGLAIRYPGAGDAAYAGMCELQVLDDAAPAYAGLQPWQFHGSAYGLVPAQRGYLRPAGTWNFQEVTVRGSTVTVELNGTVILDADLATVESPPSGRAHPGRTRTHGHFGFAGHGDAVAYRHVRIRPL